MNSDPNSQADQRSQVTNPPTGKASDDGLPITGYRSKTVKTVLAIASAGGHWIQLRRLHPAFEGTRLIYATTRETYRAEVEADGAEFRVIPDCNRWEKFKLIKAAVKIFLLIVREKPDVVISTGAAPGFFATRFAKFLGKKTIWVDSIANAEELSLSGQKAGGHVDKWITQWKHLARRNGPHFFGNVLGDDTAHEASQDSISAIKNHGSKVNDQKDVSSETTLKEREDKTSIENPDPRLTITDYRSSSTNERSAIKSGPKLQIFVTVGTDLPFDRLVKTIDDWAENNADVSVFAQIGETRYSPRNIEFSQFIEPPLFRKRFTEADIIISHAGMGTILSSLTYNKPLLVMPRIAAKGEHRNEHQLATAKRLSELDKVCVANDETELSTALENLRSLTAKAQISPYAQSNLTNALRGFISIP